MKSRKPARILQAITSLGLGGAEMQLLQILPRLNQRKKVYTEIAYLKGGGEAAGLFQGKGIKVHKIRMNAPWDPASARGLGEVLDRGRFHGIHSHLFKADVHGAWAAGQKGLPLFSTKHNQDPYIRWPVVAWLSRRLSLRASKTCFISQGVWDYYRNQSGVNPKSGQGILPYGFSPKKVGVRQARALRKSLGIGPRDAAALCPARFEAQKGHRDLIECWHAMGAKAPQLVLAGAGSLAEDLRALARKGPATNRIRFIGQREDVEALCAALDFVVLASHWEGLGLVFLEAMGQGKPVVATRVGGIPEVVEHGKTGLLVELGDVEGLKKAVRKLARDKGLRKRMGQRGRAKLAREFRISKIVGQWEELYLGTLKREDIKPKAMG